MGVSGEGNRVQPVPLPDRRVVPKKGWAAHPFFDSITVDEEGHLPRHGSAVNFPLDNYLQIIRSFCLTALPYCGIIFVYIFFYPERITVMKKWLVLIAAVVLTATLSVAAQAADTVIGEIYSSSILATVDGQPIPSYNIGGRTCICIEDLAYYGFDVDWDPDARLISAVSSASAVDYTKYADTKRGETGSILGYIYETDIRATVNGLEVPSYNIGGITCVCIEDLGELSGSPYAQYGYSKYFLKAFWDDKNGIIDLGTFRILPEAQNPVILAGLEYGCVYRTGEAWGTVEIGEKFYNDFRGAIRNLIPLFYKSSAGVTDIVVGYACPYGVTFDENAIAKILGEGLYVQKDPSSFARDTILEEDFRTIMWLETEDVAIVYGQDISLADDPQYSLRVFTSEGEIFEVLDNLPFVERAEKIFPVEDLRLSAGETEIYFSITYEGRSYDCAVDLYTLEVEMG